MKNSTIITAVFVGVIVTGFIVGEVVYTYKKINREKKEITGHLEIETTPQDPTGTPVIMNRVPALDHSSVTEWSRPGVGFKKYIDDNFGFTITYPSTLGFKVSNIFSNDGYYNRSINRILQFSLVGDMIERASFSVYANNDAKNIQACLALPSGAPILNTKSIQGNTLWVALDHANDASMGGSRGRESNYRILRDGYCYMIQTQILWYEVGYEGYKNSGVYSATAQERQAQKDAVQKYSDVLDAMVASFTFLETPTGR